MKDYFYHAVKEIADELYLPEINRLKSEIERLQGRDEFLSYPGGIQKFLGKSYDVVYRMWNQKDFPRAENGVKGVYLNDLKQWQKRQR